MGQLSHNVNEDESERTYSYTHTQILQQKYGFDTIKDHTKMISIGHFI